MIWIDTGWVGVRFAIVDGDQRDTSRWYCFVRAMTGMRRLQSTGEMTGLACSRSAGKSVLESIVRLAALIVLGVLAGCSTTPRKEIFAAYQTQMQDRGFLRTAADPQDAPFSNRDLAENFRRIAFFTYPNDEVHIPKPLTKWEGPVRYALMGADSARPEVDELMARLARLTELDIAPEPEKTANFLIMVLDEEQRRLAMRALRDDETRDYFESFLSAIFDCGAISGWSDDDPVIRKTLIYLHGDLQGLYRKLCFHEEIAQSFGLFNDDPTVRPSIFNDDDEFALLTTHDEYLLRILYDRRLKPGMTPSEAMPLVERIIEELRPSS